MEATKFFNGVFNDLGKDVATAMSRARLCIVQHITGNSVEFIKCLDRMFLDTTVFAKPRSINRDIMEELTRHGIKVKTAMRDCNPVSHYLDGDTATPTVLCDIGGYFSTLAQIPNLPILGIVEDTENGQQKYEAVAGTLHYPVASVARSPLKEHEDRLVGESIVNCTDKVLGEIGNTLRGRTAGVIGYGKVGAGIACGLKKKGIIPLVAEINPLRMANAIKNDCRPVTSYRDVLHADAIFSATGNKVLNYDDIKQLRGGPSITTATSWEDEFNASLSWRTDFTHEQVAPHITKMTREDKPKNYFHLINGGNPPNFLYDGTDMLTPAIYLVMAEIMANAGAMCQQKRLDTCIVDMGVNRDKIARRWVGDFGSVIIE